VVTLPHYVPHLTLDAPHRTARSPAHSLVSHLCAFRTGFSSAPRGLPFFTPLFALDSAAHAALRRGSAVQDSLPTHTHVALRHSSRSGHSPFSLRTSGLPLARLPPLFGLTGSLLRSVHCSCFHSSPASTPPHGFWFTLVATAHNTGTDHSCRFLHSSTVWTCLRTSRVLVLHRVPVLVRLRVSDVTVPTRTTARAIVDTTFCARTWFLPSPPFTPRFGLFSCCGLRTKRRCTVCAFRTTHVYAGQHSHCARTDSADAACAFYPPSALGFLHTHFPSLCILGSCTALPLLTLTGTFSLYTPARCAWVALGLLAFYTHHSLHAVH